MAISKYFADFFNYSSLIKYYLRSSSSFSNCLLQPLTPDNLPVYQTPTPLYSPGVAHQSVRFSPFSRGGDNRACRPSMPQTQTNTLFNIPQKPLLAKVKFNNSPKQLMKLGMRSSSKKPQFNRNITQNFQSKQQQDQRDNSVRPLVSSTMGSPSSRQSCTNDIYAGNTAQQSMSQKDNGSTLQIEYNHGLKNDRYI